MRKFERTNGKINPCGTLKETEKKKIVIIKLEDIYLLHLYFWLKLFLYYIGFKI